jgi:adenylate kinase
MIIVITGTPGTGKSTLASMLARRLRGVHVDVSRLVVEEGLWTGVDSERSGSLIADREAIVEKLEGLVGETEVLVIDSHFGEEIASELPGDKIIIAVRLDPFILADRLRRRSWPLRKVRENIEAEILGVCTANALGKGLKACEIDATGLSPERLLAEALAIVRGDRPCQVYVDWLERHGARVLDLLSVLEE